MSKENIITQIKKNSNEVYRISEKEYEKIMDPIKMTKPK